MRPIAEQLETTAGTFGTFACGEPGLEHQQVAFMTGDQLIQGKLR